MDKITEMITELSDAVNEEFFSFYTDEITKNTSTVFEDAHEIDIYKHLQEFLTDTPEEYLDEYEAGCLLKKKGRILRELYLFIFESLDAPPYGSYEQCSEIVSGYIEIGF